MVHFSVAISNRWKNKEGKSQEYTEWVNVEAWGRLGEARQKYLKKGRLKTDKYETEGENLYFTKVFALAMQMLDRKPAEEPEMTVEEQAPEYEAEPA